MTRIGSEKILGKPGVDIDNLPRRTTNIIERFQDSLDTFSEMTASLDSNNNFDNANANNDEVDEVEDVGASIRRLERKHGGMTTDGMKQTTRRKSKREIIYEDGVVHSDTKEGKETAADDDLKQSIPEEHERFTYTSTQTETEANVNEQSTTAKKEYDILPQMSDSYETAKALAPQALLAQQMQVQATLACSSKQRLRQLHQKIDLRLN